MVFDDVNDSNEIDAFIRAFKTNQNITVFATLPYTHIAGF